MPAHQEDPERRCDDQLTEEVVYTTSAPRDPLADHLITPPNAALLLIDYQSAQVASVRSMDHDLLVKNAVSSGRAADQLGFAGVRAPAGLGSAGHRRRCRRDRSHRPPPEGVTHATEQGRQPGWASLCVGGILCVRPQRAVGRRVSHAGSDAF
jgi:hypothetical protein